MNEAPYKVMFWVLFFLVCVALVADIASGFGTVRAMVAAIVPALLIGAVLIGACGYIALAYVFWADGQREKRMSKAELEREYLRRASGVDKSYRI
jgi:hypothetical protein